VKFLFTTLQTYESAFYGTVGEELARRGHSVSHLTVSRASARELRERGIDATCVLDVIAALPPLESLGSEIERIEATYDIPSIRDVYRADWVGEGKPEQWNLRRAIDHFRAIEQVFDEVRPDVLVPEVGNETIRVAAHLVALEKGVPVLLLFYTIFPNPLRLYVDTLHAPIVPVEELRPLMPAERAEVDAFIREFTEQATPIRPYRRVPIELRRVRLFAGHLSRKREEDRDNEYLRPWRLLSLNASEWVRARAARPFYDSLDPARPYVYFPLHVVDDYKIKRVIPHCVDQASIVEQVADALPPGCDLVLKEHPMSLGRNSIALLRRLRRRANVRLVGPYTGSHELVRGSAAVAVISSTVGLEALLYEKPVLTLGEPFYSGYGITLDCASFAEIRDKVPALLRFRPDADRIRSFLFAAMSRCYPGAPVLVDRSDDNARSLADSIDRASSAVVAERHGVEEPALIR
jgi:hypothetical protein